jgi:hypothetical protein
MHLTKDIGKPNDMRSERAVSLWAHRRTGTRSSEHRRHADEKPRLLCGKQGSSKPRPDERETKLSGIDATLASWLNEVILNAFFAYPQNSAAPWVRPIWTAPKRAVAFSPASVSLLRDCCATDLLPSDYSSGNGARQKARVFKQCAPISARCREAF